MAYLFSSGPAPDPLDAGDANDDGVVSVADASYLANYNSSGPAPPYPFPSAGFDITADTLETDCDATLAAHASVSPSSLTAYLPTSASSMQDIRPLVTQRGVGLDGSLRAAPTQPFHLAGNPMEPAHIGQEVINEATGAYGLVDIDIALPATGFSWVVGRTYNCVQQTSGGAARDSNGYQGKNWFQVSQPEIVHRDGASDSQDLVYLIYGADRFVEFKRLDKTGTASNTFRGINGAAGAIVFTSGGTSVPDTYTYTDQHGYRHTFFGFDGDAGSAAGQFWKTEIVDGASPPAVQAVAYVGHATDPATAISSGYSSGRIQYAYDTADRKYTYTYQTLDGAVRLTQVKAETKTGGTWAGSPTGVEEVARVEYGYYTDETHGDPGDLELVTRTMDLSDTSADPLVTSTYYRYYEGTYDASTNPGRPHQLRLVVGPEGIRRYGSSYASASFSALEPYSMASFRYADDNHRITECWMHGACGCSGGPNGSYTFAYGTSGTDDSPAYEEDEWRYRTVVKRPTDDSLTPFVTLYFDEVAQPLARVLTNADPSASPTQTWSTVLDRDSMGVVARVHTPANVTGYTHSTGTFTTSTTAGLVMHFERDAGPGCMGFLSDRKWSLGTSGTAYLDGSYTYQEESIAAGDTKVLRPFVASMREYPDAITSGTSGSNLTGVATTVYSGTLLPEFVTTTLPAVSTGQNGDGATKTLKGYFTLVGNNTYSRTIDGIISYRVFDAATGQMTQSTQDADTTSLSEPTGFASTGTPFDLSTTYVYDPQGRLERVGLPSGQNKDRYYSQLGDGRLVELAYNDVQSGTYYGPVQYSVRNLNGEPEITALIGLDGNDSTAPQSTHVDDESSDPIDAVSALGVAAHIVSNIYDDSGFRRTAMRTYYDTDFESPTTWPGTEGTHYDETLYDHDDSGRVRRTKAPHGTITRTVRDVVGNTIESWTGTNDNGLSGGESSGTNNMVKTMAYEYDGGAAGGNQYLTQMTAYVEGSTTGQRVTNYLNDGRGRRVVENRPWRPMYSTRSTTSAASWRPACTTRP